MMGAFRAQDCDEIAVQTLNAGERGEPVFYSSLPRGAARCKQRLISTLWEHCLTRENFPGKHADSFNSKESPLQVKTDPLGKPYLLVGNRQGPAISFSECAGTVWAALSGGESDIGIDLAGGDEFPETYPFQRVFQQRELQHTLHLTAGTRAEAAALLWSIKEAAVKALGCAFHTVDPRQLSVSPSSGGAHAAGGGHSFTVELSGKARERFPQAVGRPLMVRSITYGANWLSIARTDRMTVRHG